MDSKKMLSNLLILQGETLLRKVDPEVLSDHIKYVLAERKGKPLKLFKLTKILRDLVTGKNKDCVLEDLQGDLPFHVLKADQSLLEISDLSYDHVIVFSSDDSADYIIEDASERKSYEMFSEIVKNFQEEIFVTDAEGRILFVNSRGAEIIGLQVSEMIGCMVEDLVKAGYISSSGAIAVIEKKQKVDIMQCLKKTNSWRLCTGVPLLNKKNEIVFTLCTSKDMTELVEIKKELDNKEDELKQKNSELSNMQNELFAQVNFISKSDKMREIKEAIKKIAPTDLTVMIQGETGVGKEVVARAIHAFSPRRHNTFLKINCASFPDTLFSSEMFGYEGGAFTGANSNGKKGKIELAHKGTLFLDEIGEIPNDIQIKLLEFLQDLELFRIGGTKKIKVDTRIIVATNRKLDEDVKNGRFRKDLYYRLNLIPLTIPPLRERRDDIPALISYYLDLYNRKHSRDVAFSEEVLRAFINYQWPGNVRELEHILERAVVMHVNGIGTKESYPKLLLETQPSYQGVYCPDIIPYKQAKRELERELVAKAYLLYGSTYKTAKALGIAQSTVVRILKRLEGYTNQ